MLNRRDVLLALGAVASTGLPSRALSSALNDLQFACIGVGGKGASGTADAAKMGKVVAICDIDEGRLEKAATTYPNARRFTDFREIIPALGSQVDAVVISTPNHTHAVIAAQFLRADKHCFCEKPLGHSVEENRTLARLAREHRVVTQMNSQGTAGDKFREAVEIVRSGALGEISDVHCWSNRPVWPQGNVQVKSEPVPAGIHWDEFVGPAPFRPYSRAYHPFLWRGFWNFGDSAIGDMGTHSLYLPYLALDLRNPTRIAATTAGHDRITYPLWCQIEFQFPATSKRAPVKVWWYDGGKKPDERLLQGMKAASSGLLLIGSEGTLYSDSDYGATYKLLPEAKFAGFQPPAQLLNRSTGHFQDFVAAIRGGDPTLASFSDSAANLSELVCLGNLAVWAGTPIEWDAKEMKVTNVSGLDERVRLKYRSGYSLD